MEDRNGISLGQRIVNRRNELGMKQCDLATKAGISNRTMCDYEKGNTTPDAIALASISKVLGVTADYLIGLSALKNPEYNSIAPTEFEYALYDEIKDLNKEEKRIILSVARGIKDSKRNF